MNQATAPRWESMRTDETRDVEALLSEGFDQADAYRYNSASIRVRVIDRRFEGMSNEERDTMVESYLDRLPRETQADIMNLLTLAPGETANSFRKWFANQEFEDPSPSGL